MSRSSVRPLRRTVAAAVALASATLVGVGTPARAAAPHSGPALTIVYDAVGTSTIARSGVTVPLGPTELTAGLAQDLSFRADLPLPRQSVSLTAPGGHTVTADVLFRQIGKAKGALLTTSDGFAVTSTATYHGLLRQATVDGKPQHVGRRCRTTTPFTATVQTPSGQSFDISNGGPLDGTFTMPNFQNCRSATALVNQLVPGPGNSLHLVLSNGHVND